MQSRRPLVGFDGGIWYLGNLFLWFVLEGGKSLLQRPGEEARITLWLVGLAGLLDGVDESGAGVVQLSALGTC